jgi:histidine ammonia-lyase
MDRQMALLMSHDVGSLLGENLVNHAKLGDQARLHHGFKAMQITVSALTAEILQNSLSATIFSRPTESGNQDVVSMGTIAARGLTRMIHDAKSVAAVLAMAVCQGYALAAERGYEIPLTKAAAQWLRRLQSAFVPLIEDRPMDDDITVMSDTLFNEKEL